MGGKVNTQSASILRKSTGALKVGMSNGGTVQGEVLKRPVVVSDVVALRALAPEYDGQQFILLGYSAGWAATAKGALGGGEFFYHASDTTSADDGVINFVTAGSHRIKRKRVPRISL